MQGTHTKVAWLQYYQPLNKGGNNLINSSDAMVDLLEEWIVNEIEPIESNLYILLKHHLKE